MKIAISELEHLRQEVKNCHQIIKDMQKKRPWVGLTDEEWQQIQRDNFQADQHKAIEAKLKEKNSD